MNFIKFIFLPVIISISLLLIFLIILIDIVEDFYQRRFRRNAGGKRKVSKTYQSALHIYGRKT